MRVGLAIYNLLSNESSVSSIVGNKIFPETAPQGQEAPYVVYSVISNTPSNVKETGETIDIAQVEIYSVETAYSKAITLGEGIRAALDRRVGAFNTVYLQTSAYKNEAMEVNDTRLLWANIQDYEMRVKLL
tara:strand:+ start:853 stop:1245 length:393 start_codon:yes stop_codon:yes gene_type:complete